MQTARRRGRQGEEEERERGECCEQVRGECVNIAPGRIEKQMSNENRKQGRECRERSTTGSREGSGGTVQAGRARTHIAGWSPFWEVGEFSAKGKVDERTQDGRTTSMSNVHKFMTSLPSQRRVPHGCVLVCAGGRFVVVPFRCCCSCCCCACRLFTLSASRGGQGEREAATLQWQWADA